MSGIKVIVFNNDIDQALKILKKKIQNDGLMRLVRQRRYFERPGEKKRRKRHEAIRKMEMLKKGIKK